MKNVLASTFVLALAAGNWITGEYKILTWVFIFLFLCNFLGCISSIIEAHQKEYKKEFEENKKAINLLLQILEPSLYKKYGDNYKAIKEYLDNIR